MSDQKQDEHLEKKAEEHIEYLKEYDKDTFIPDLINAAYNQVPYKNIYASVDLRNIFTNAATDLIKDISENRELMLEFGKLLAERLADNKTGALYNTLMSDLRDLCYDQEILKPDSE